MNDVSLLIAYSTLLSSIQWNFTIIIHFLSLFVPFFLLLNCEVFKRCVIKTLSWRDDHRWGLWIVTFILQFSGKCLVSIWKGKEGKSLKALDAKSTFWPMILTVWKRKLMTQFIRLLSHLLTHWPASGRLLGYILTQKYRSYHWRAIDYCLTIHRQMKAHSHWFLFCMFQTFHFISTFSLFSLSLTHWK